MFFKNLNLYRLPEQSVTLDVLREQLGKHAFAPCGPHDFESCGWVAPCDGGELVHAVGDDWLVCLQTETKILPAAVIKTEAAKRAAQIEREQGFKPGRKQLKELREEVTLQLLPRAFTRIRRVHAWIATDGLIVVDAASASRAEDVLMALIHDADLPARPLRTSQSPVSAMAEWLTAGEAPDGFIVDQDCTVSSFSDDNREVSYKHGLHDEQVREHIAAGCLPVKLALTFEDRISFVLTERGTLKRLEFLDVVRESIADADPEDTRALFNAEFALMTGELRHLLPAVVNALGGEVDSDKPNIAP